MMDKILRVFLSNIYYNTINRTPQAYAIFNSMLKERGHL